MSPEDTAVQTARDDLAFMKALVEGAGRNQPATGAAFVAAGLIYGVQLVGHWAQALGWLPLPPLGHVVLAVGPTVVFLCVLFAIIRREKKLGRYTTGSMNKAFQAVFGATGMTNLVLIAVFLPAAISRSSLEIWLFYPAVVYALQGGAWLVAWTLRREWWMAVTAVGWAVCAIAMGLTIGSPTYIPIAAAGLLFFMVLPGLAMMRQAKAG